MHGFIFHTRHSQITFQSHFPTIQAPSTIIPLGEYGFLLPHRLKRIYTNTTPTVLFFGNIRPYKGLDLLIRAFPRIREQIPAAKLLIAGQPLSSFEPYQQLIAEHNLTECVETHFGYIPDERIPQLLNSVTAAALPYRAIDQSAVLMLLMAYGMPIVAAQIGGLEEILRNGQTGLLVPPNDTQALADALIHLLQNPDESRRLGENARHDAETQFAWKSIAENTIQFYQSVIQTSSSSSRR
jgi:glycosyltransferase involved in cell wall biosynthesis